MELFVSLLRSYKMILKTQTIEKKPEPGLHVSMLEHWPMI